MSTASCAILAPVTTPLARLVRLALVVLLGGVGVGLCVAALVPGVRLLTSTSRVDEEITLGTLDERTTVYDAEGNVIAYLGLIDRAPVELADVPDVVIDAVIAIEDQTFWENPGVDVKAALRAVLANVDEGEVAQGGSTITQQLVKKRVVGEKQDLDRKAREVVLALRLDDEYSKEEILEEYLNTVYFGQGAYGIQSAAQRFFIFQGLDGNVYPKQLPDLTLADAALLAGLIQNPEGYNPFANPDRARARRAAVLARMREDGYITEAQEREAGDAPLPSIPPPKELRPDNYFVEEVQRRLLSDPALGLGDTLEERREKLLLGGLRIYTTYDARAQTVAQAAVDQIVPDQPPFTASLAAIDPANGEVRAIVGGPNFQQVQYNLATQGARQPGSTYKAVTLAAALSAGWSPEDVVDGSSPCTVTYPGLPPYPTKNAGDNVGGGRMSLRRATTGSVNCAYARVIAALGPKAVSDMAKRLGITTEVPPYLSITLGTVEATPLDMASVFATLAAGGVYHEPTFVRQVAESDGSVLYERRASAGRRVLSREVALNVVDILRGVVTGGTGTAARLADGRPVAGKTGTSDETTDAWFCGIVPQLSACVWMGAPVGRVPMTNVGGITVYGGTYPAQVWKRFMDAELVGVPAVDFEPAPPLAAAPGVVEDGRRYNEDEYQDFVQSTTTTTAPPPPPPPPTTTTTTAPPPPPSSSSTTTTTAPPEPEG